MVIRRASMIFLCREDNPTPNFGRQAYGGRERRGARPRTLCIPRYRSHLQWTTSLLGGVLEQNSGLCGTLMLDEVFQWTSAVSLSRSRRIQSKRNVVFRLFASGGTKIWTRSPMLLTGASLGVVYIEEIDEESFLLSLIDVGIFWFSCRVKSLCKETSPLST